MAGLFPEINIEKYYQDIKVLGELTRFLKKRWVAIHCERRLKDGRHILLRYRRGRPLKIESIQDIIFLLKNFRYLRPRTFYGTANIYKKIFSKEDVQDFLNNTEGCTPTWDIDSKIEWWKVTLKVGKIIIDELSKNRINESIWLKWSGNGLHVHVNEKAFSKEIIEKYGALNIAFSVVDYVIKKTLPKINSLVFLEGKSIKVENLIDPQRVFTSPLSLHRELSVSCVAFKPEEIDNFSVEWVNPVKFRHNWKWHEFVEGEGDELALKAVKMIGGYPTLKRSLKTMQREKIEKRIMKYIPRYSLGCISLEQLRLVEDPLPLDPKRVSRGFGDALIFLEDLLTYYVRGSITQDEAVKVLEAIVNITIPTLLLEEDKRKCLLELYNNVIKLISEMSPLEMKRWLLMHGVPRKRIRRLF